MNEQSQYDSDLIAEASEWAVTIAMDDVDEHDRRRFAAWLEASQEHADVYQETCSALDHPIFAAVLAQAAHDASDDDAQVPESASILAFVASWVPDARTMRIGGGIAAIAATVLIALWGMPLMQVAPWTPSDRAFPSQVVTAEHATSGAETRQVSLPDGSFATLGAKSAMTMVFTAEARRVTLLEGDVYFDVVSDSSRPFIVSAGNTTVRAVGTAFDVRLAVGSVRVDVVEGAVRVQSRGPAELMLNPSEPPAIAITAKAGERLIFEPEDGLTKRPTPPNVELAAWRTGRLEYFGEALSRVVADANRYYDGNIMITSDEIETMKVTGSFPTSSVENVFELLAEQVPIEVAKTDKGDILLSASEG